MLEVLWCGLEGRRRSGGCKFRGESGGSAPAMGSDGGHERRCRLVQGVHGREGEQRSSRGRSGAALYGEATAHRGHGLWAPVEMAAVATGGGSGLSAALVGVVQVGGEGKGKRGRVRGIARVRLPIGALGRPVRVRAEASGGRERRGTGWWRVAGVEAPRLALLGGSRCSVVAASTVACSASRSRACKWPASAAFCAHPRVHLCLASVGRVNKREGGFGCSVTCQEWERDEKGREKWLSREEKWGSTPP